MKILTIGTQIIIGKTWIKLISNLNVCFQL